MKHLIFAFSLMLYFQAVGQEVKTFSGVVTYKSTPNNHLDKLPKNRAAIFKKMYETTKDARFILTFNNNESFFEVEKIMGNDSPFSGIGIAKTFVAEGSFYTNLKENLLIKKVDEGGEELLVSIKLSPTATWEITKDTKMIHNFKCFKATKIKTNINTKGIVFNFKIVAWFAPEIPARFGPKQFSNLPGLILELNDTHHNFLLETITLFNKAPKIKPFKGDIITEEVYLKITNENLGAFRDGLQKN